jgi:hypothetical protein
LIIIKQQVSDKRSRASRKPRNHSLFRCRFSLVYPERIRFDRGINVGRQYTGQFMSIGRGPPERTYRADSRYVFNCDSSLHYWLGPISLVRSSGENKLQFRGLNFIQKSRWLPQEAHRDHWMHDL